jgi:hypothetical protein
MPAAMPGSQAAHAAMMINLLLSRLAASLCLLVLLLTHPTTGLPATTGWAAAAAAVEVVGCGARPKSLPFSPFVRADTGSGIQRTLAHSSPFEAAGTRACDGRSSMLVVLGSDASSGRKASLANYSLATGTVQATPLVLNHSHQEGFATSWSVEGLRFVGGRLLGIVFQGEYGWIHGVFSIDATGGMRRVASIPMDAELLTGSVAVDQKAGVYYFMAQAQGSMVVDLHAVHTADGLHTVTPVVMGGVEAAQGRLPSQLVAVNPAGSTGAVGGGGGGGGNGMLYGWAYEPAALMSLDPTTGVLTRVDGVQLPGYMTDESVVSVGPATAGIIVASGFYNDAQETGWLATVDLIERQIVHLVNTSQPLAMVCKAAVAAPRPASDIDTAPVSAPPPLSWQNGPVEPANSTSPYSGARWMCVLLRTCPRTACCACPAADCLC